MCVTDDCDDGTDRRTFITGAAGALIGAAVTNAVGQTYPHNYKVVTRVLDEPRITHGHVTFQHGGKETIDGFLARPKAEGTLSGGSCDRRKCDHGRIYSEHVRGIGDGGLRRTCAEHFPWVA